VRRYVSDHWSGQHHILQSVLVNGALIYLFTIAVYLLLAMLLGWPSMTPTTVRLSALPFLVVVAWSWVGIVRSAIRTIRNTQTHWIWKAVAVIAVLLVAHLLLALANDIRYFAFR